MNFIQLALAAAMSSYCRFMYARKKEKRERSRTTSTNRKGMAYMFYDDYQDGSSKGEKREKMRIRLWLRKTLFTTKQGNKSGIPKERRKNMRKQSLNNFLILQSFLFYLSYCSTSPHSTVTSQLTTYIIHMSEGKAL